jgi:hypothetical protein
VADAATGYAAGSQAFDPNGQNSWESQFISDEAQGDIANNAHGILSGFKIPTDMSPGDLKGLVSTMEDYANQVGWKHMPSPTEAINAWKAGATDYQSAAKIWGAKLPPAMGWVKHGMRASDFSAYKENEANRQSVLTRFGAHGDSKDENFVANLDKPLQSFGAQGSTIGQRPQEIDTTGAGKSAVR